MLRLSHKKRYPLLALVTTLVLAVGPAASAADNPYQRGPAPTPASIAAPTGPFATASVTVPRGNGFGGGVIYYPTATNEGTFGAVAISPGLNGTWPGIAWLGPRLASQGFVVFGIAMMLVQAIVFFGSPPATPAAAAITALLAYAVLAAIAAWRDARRPLPSPPSTRGG